MANYKQNQRFAVDGESSIAIIAIVKSGVPQGTILDPLCSSILMI